MGYIPQYHIDSEQVNKRLSPTNSKELHSRFTCPCRYKTDHNWNFLADLTGPAAGSNIYGFTPTY